MRKSVLCIAALAAGAVCANVFDPIVFRGSTDKADPTSYRVGEPIVMTFTLAGAAPEIFGGKYFIDWKSNGDDGVETKGRLPLDGKTPLRVKTSLAVPGNVRVEAYIVNADGSHVMRDNPCKGSPAWEAHGKEVEFIGGALVESEKLVQARAEPADFDAFWARQKARLAAVPMDVEREEVAPAGNCRVWKVKVACAGPRPMTGYLSVPKNAKAKSLKAICEFHGYGTGVQTAPKYAQGDAIVLSVNAHGYDFDRDKAYYDNFMDGIHTPKVWGYGFSTWQNEYPEGCYFNGMALRLLRAFDFVRTLPEWDGRNLQARGGSQGGLQTMWAAGLVEGLTLAQPTVPWCCDLGPEAVKNRMVPGWRIAWTKGISYYDPVNFAKRAKCRVEIMRAGLGDTCCLPSSIAILYNNLPKDNRSINWVQGSKHGYVPPSPNQSVELPSGKVVAPYVGENVFLGSKL